MVAVSVTNKKRSPAVVVKCLISGVDGGGVSDDCVSTKKSGFDREFSVIASMLKRIEPLDNSIISKGVSESAKDSMKQTISTMLGLLPSDQFSVTVRVSKRPLDRLLASSIITGYTLWNAEYRISLMRNFDLSPDCLKRPNLSEENEVLEERRETRDDGIEGAGIDGCGEDLEKLIVRSSLGDLTPEALDYIRQLELELSAAKEELHVQKQENLQMEHIRESNNDLLKYLRTLDSDMVTELSKPSSLEVEEVIHQLVQCTSRRLFEETTSKLNRDSSFEDIEKYQNDNDDTCDTIATSRDYLAKLLFWCMLLGHHMKGLENRLHLSCAVGLL